MNEFVQVFPENWQKNYENVHGAEAWRDIPDCPPSQVGETKTSCHRQNDGKVAQGYAL